MTMYPTVMEIVVTLRSQAESSPTFPDKEAFLNILQDVQNELPNDQHNDIDVKVVRCINLEGLDGVGKTTLTNQLAQCPGFGILRTLPDNLRSFRSFFDELNEDVKRKFYYLCNILVSRQLILSSDTTVWILDRYLPSTIAYQLAHEHQIDLSSIPDCLPWPTYLVQPSHIVYLYLSEKKRCERIALRSSHEPIVPEEEKLASDNKFRERLDAIYRRIPNIHPIDTDGTSLQIAEKILEWFRNN